MQNNLILVNYTVKFLDGDGALINEVIAQTEAQVNAICTNEDSWPANAEFVQTAPVYRRPIMGIDYGSGSVKNRFGGGYVPRGAYQFRG